jgi:nucleoside 2-deoxyribosyltransferase
MAISRANEKLIRGSKALIANLTPFRGPSADVGTAYELGFARALNLPVFAYSNECGTLLERTRRHFGDQMKQVVNFEAEESVSNSNQMEIENYGLVDNLMIVGEQLRRAKARYLSTIFRNRSGSAIQIFPRSNAASRRRLSVCAFSYRLIS